MTKHIFMALINAYAAHGQFEKAKQVLDLDLHAFYSHEDFHKSCLKCM